MRIYGRSAARDRQGWFFGLTGPQLFLMLGAGFPVWLAMALGQWLALLFLVPAWAVLAALICVPIRGWSAAQWIGVMLRHLVGQAAGWTRWHAPAVSDQLEDPGEADLPGVLAGIQVHDGPPMAGRTERPAVIQNHSTRTWAATARIAHPGIGMSDEDERFRMGSGLAEMLESATASNQIHLVAIQVRSIPDDGTERAEWVRQHARADEPAISRQLHAQLDAATRGAAVRTEAFVTVVAHEDTIGRDAKRAGRGVLGRARILYGLLGEVEARLVGALGCTSVTWLDTAELAVAIRTGFEPGDAPALADAAIHHRHEDTIPRGVPLAAAGPATASTAMRSYRHGEWDSTSTTILLPRKGALMGALARTLVPSRVGERRSLTVFYTPVSHRRANQRTGRAEMSAAMGAEMRRKVGKVERAKDRHATQHLADTDEKLERGRSLVHATAAIAVTVPATWNAQDYGRRLDAAVRLCGFTPLPLDGAHDAAFAAATIPLGVGLPNRRVREMTAPMTRVTSTPDPPHHRQRGWQPGRQPGRRRKRPVTRSLDDLLSDFGTHLPRKEPPAPEPPPDRVFPHSRSVRGSRACGHGWSPTLPPLAGYLMTSEETPVLWPLIAGDGLRPTGAPMGFDVLSGGAFHCDPLGWVNDDEVGVTNPNVFIFGKPGRGKSALVKVLMLRMIRFGYRSLVLGDVKDEYEHMSRALGVEPYRIGPGLPGRINPLDMGPLAADWERQSPLEAARRGALIFKRWSALIRGLVGSQDVSFTPTESRVINKVLRELTGWARGQTTLTEITIPMVWAALDNPTSDLVSQCRYQSLQDFYDGTRALRDALGALCEGELDGLFDSASTFQPNWRAPIQTLSLNALHGDGNEAAVGIALMCLNSWGQGMREMAEPGDRRIVLRDEAWMQTRLGLEAVKTLDSNLRMSRNDGDIQIVTYHKPSDPLSAGDHGSQAAQIAKDLLHLADVRILMGQDSEVAAELRQLLGLTAMQQHIVTDWAMQAKGRALWMVGDRRYKVQTLLTPLEQDLTYTNEAIATPR